MLAFKAVGCHLKSTGAPESALNPAGRREGRLESGEGKKKSSPMSDTRLESEKGGAGMMCCCLFVFALTGYLRYN